MFRWGGGLVLCVLFFTHAAAYSNGSIAVTKDNPTIIRSGPSEDYDRLAEVAPDLKFSIITTQGDWTQVRLSKNASGWIETKSLVTVPGGLPSHPILKLIKIQREPRDIWMEITESEPGMVLTQEWLRPSVLWLKFPNAASALSEIDYDPGDPIIFHVSVWQESDDMVSVRVDLKGFYGFRMFQKDPHHLVVKFNRKPSAEVFKGLKVCLDPGHGGQDSGAIGPKGLKEKNVALSISKMLGSLLKNRGAEVIFTRLRDKELTSKESEPVEELERRVEVARNNGAQLFVSLHCNARPTVAEGRIARGSFVYYYQPQSFELAKEVSQRLEEQIHEPEYGVIFRSYHVVRQTDMPAILVETAFISNPVTEAKLRRGSFQKAIARGIFLGILHYVRSL